MRKRFCSIILAAAMIMTMIPFAMAADPSGFDDVSGHWAESSIERWSGYGVVGGAGDGTFAPDGVLTHAQAAQIFANLLGLTTMADIGQYGDVAVGSWYYDAIAKCVAAGILTGDGAGAMSPEAVVSREQLFVMFARAMGIEPKASSDTAFADSGEVSSWAAGYINALADMGAIQGSGDGTLNPSGDMNRASFVAVLDQTISGYANTDGATVGGTQGIVLVVAENVTVVGNVENLVIAGGSAGISGSTVENITVSGDNASVSVGGSAVVGQVNVTGANASVAVSGQASVAHVTVADTAVNAGVAVDGDAAVSVVDSAASNVTISGTGTVETANVSGDNTTVNTDGTDLTVSQGTTGVTENNKPVSGGASVETQPEAPQPSNPVIPPVHYHSYNTTEIKAKDDESVVVGILYTCYAGDDSYIEWNGNAVAKVGEDYYVDLNNAISAGGTVDLLKDVISPTETIVVDGKTVALNLNGNTISASGYDGAIYAKNGAQVTINGEGTIIGNDVNKYAMAVWSCGTGTHVTINGGTYQNNKAEGNTDEQMDMIYASDGGTITINGGTFDCITPQWTLNVKDSDYASNPDTIQVTGGTFKNYNPSASKTENPVANYLADGYTVTKNGEWFTVIPVPEGVIAVNDEAGLKEALSQVTDGGTIMLAGDITLTSPLTINQNVTLMGYGNQIVAGGFEGHYVSIASSVTNVTIQNVAFAEPTNQKDNASCLYANGFGGKLVVEGCTFTDTQWDSIQITPADGADITITGCTFINPNSTSHRYLHIEAADTSGACTAKVTVTNNHFGTGNKVNDSIIDIDYIDYHVKLIAGGNTFEDETVADGDIFVCKTYPGDILNYAEAYNWFVKAI